MKPEYFVTTPIYYPSGKPHIGHAYCSIATDVVARYKRLLGYDVMFLTGTDEHGKKIEINSQKAGTTPKKYVDALVKQFKNLWKNLDISYDQFIRTTDDSHKKAVQKIFKKLYEKGEIYKGHYKGWYCVPDEAFFTDKQLVDGKCPDCQREVIWQEEEAYFFKLSQYQDKLLEFYEKNPNFLLPTSCKNEMVEFIKKGLDDLCVSRTSFSWGVPVDFDEKHVVYVWLDALTNYITALGYTSANNENFKKYWPADLHIVGKEIVRFHAVIWPAILMALNLPLPQHLFGHGWLLFGDGSKMSKSKGNVVDPDVLIKRYSKDVLRYFLLREFPFGTDGNFSYQSFIARINGDLCNDLGNLLSRTSAMVIKYFGENFFGNITLAEVDNEILNTCEELKTVYQNHMESLQFSKALESIWVLIGQANKYIEDTAPWVLAKNDDNRDTLFTVLYNLCEVLRVSSILLLPFLKETCLKIAQSIDIPAADLTWENAQYSQNFNKSRTVTKIAPLFPRLDEKVELEALQNT